MSIVTTKIGTKVKRAAEDGDNQGEAFSLPFYYSPKELLIIIMAANPEPCHSVVVHDANGAVPKSYPHRPDIFRLVYALEAQRRMKGIIRPKTISLLCS